MNRTEKSGVVVDSEIERGIRLGEILVEAGALQRDQVEHILSVQRRVGRPFGDLAERLYGLSPKTIERAWARQYAGLTGKVDPALMEVDAACVKLLNRRQAWQFQVVPVGRKKGELQLVTDQKHLAKAVNFASSAFGEPVFFITADAEALHELLMKHYPVPQHMAEYALAR